MPLLSVIVTTYNIEDFLDECLETVVGQTLTDMEIIVVDDGSTDGTPDIIRKYAAQDSRINPVFLPENTMGGVASAANAGLEVAQGTYIGFVDGDDYLEPTMFEELCNAAVDYGSDLAMCRYMEAVGPDKALREPAERMRWVRFNDTRCVDLGSDQNTRSILRFIAVPWRKIYARSLLDDNGIRFPVVDYFWEDNPFHWYTVCSAKTIAVVPKVLCTHRVGRPGQTMSTRNADLLKMFGHYETVRAWLDDKGILPDFHATLIGWVISQFQWIHKRIPREAGGALFDVMAEIVGPVDQAVFDRALREKRVSIRRQMRNIRNGNREAFLKYFDRQFTSGSRASAGLKKRVAKPLSFLRLGMAHAKANGWRPTAARAVQHFRSEWFSKAVFRRRNPVVTEETMLKYMTLLQRDMGRKHAEQLQRLKAIEDGLRRAQSKRGDE
ncbi:MAG TPA: hypothetical protein DIU07_12355 [Rhodobacteraceae bacterium]|nr:hypothetical protein [Paracoccaceae bacterium]